jgi:flagellin
MSLRINTNVAALNSYNNLNANQAKLEGAFQQLSSGLRINKAADDAAGLSIAQGLTSQINGLTQAVSNANDGINVAQIADGALGTTQDILQRMRGLVVKAGNQGTQDVKSLGAIQQEIKNLNTQLDNIASQTKFGQTNLLNGDYNKNFQVGANGNDTIRLNLSDASVKATDLGVDKLGIVSGGGKLITMEDAAGGATDTQVTHFGANLRAESGTATAISADLQAVFAEADSSSVLSANNNTVEGDGNGGWNIKNAGGTVIGSVKEGAGGTFTISTVDTDGNATTVATVDTMGYDESFTMSGVTNTGTLLTGASAGAPDKAVFNALSQSFTDNGGADAGFGITGDSTAGWKVFDSAGSAAQLGTISLANGVYTFKDMNNNVVGGVNANEGAEATATLDGYDSAQAAQDLTTISNAIDTVSNARSQIGAVQNQLSYTVSNLQTAITNVTASRSNLTDADLAQQVTAMTQAQILTQAATSVLAQANSAPQAILKLLQ